MGNLALHSAEEPDNQRAITGTVEVPVTRDNNAALALGARPNQQHESAACHISNVTWLMPHHSKWLTGHRSLVSIQFCLVFPLPYSSSCIWNPLSTFLSPDLFSRCFWVDLFLCGLVVSTVCLAIL